MVLLHVESDRGHHPGPVQDSVGVARVEPDWEEQPEGVAWHPLGAATVEGNRRSRRSMPAEGPEGARDSGWDGAWQ